jgi:hypothetical protein
MWRCIRNEFTLDYPETSPERFNRLQLALTSAQRVLEILAGLSQKIRQRFSPTQP